MDHVWLLNVNDQKQNFVFASCVLWCHHASKGWYLSRSNECIFPTRTVRKHFPNVAQPIHPKGFSPHGYQLYTAPIVWNLSLPTHSFHSVSVLSANISVLMNMTACSETEGLFMCQHSLQLFPEMNYIGSAQSHKCYTTKHFINALQNNCTLLLQCILMEGITSFWLCVGGIRCVAQGCCQWWIPPPGLPSSSLWLQTAPQR